VSQVFIYLLHTDYSLLQWMP